MTTSAQPYRSNVGILLFNRHGQVLIAERRTPPGAWQMPQGGIDAGETIPQAALRELGEEVGVSNVRILAELPDWLYYDFPPELAKEQFKGRYRGQQQKWVAMLFEGDDNEIDLNNHQQPEFIRWRWAELEESLDLIVSFKRPVYERLVTAFAPLRQQITEERL